MLYEEGGVEPGSRSRSPRVRGEGPPEGILRRRSVLTPVGASTALNRDSMDATDAREGPRVLVIDDDEALRELVVRIVKQAGYQVDAVGDGQAGLERPAARTYDVILSDVRMPGMDGIAFYEEVRRRYPAQADRIILMTAHVELSQYKEFMQTVRAPILQKPFTLG